MLSPLSTPLRPCAPYIPTCRQLAYASHRFIQILSSLQAKRGDRWWVWKVREGDNLSERLQDREQKMSQRWRDGDRKEWLGWKALTSSERSYQWATKQSEAQVLASSLLLSHSLSPFILLPHIPPPPAAVFFKPFLLRTVSSKPKIPANTSHPWNIDHTIWFLA